MTATGTTSEEISFAAPYRPRLVRTANLVGRGFAGTSRKLLPLTFDSVVRAAERKSGLAADPDDETFREPLALLLTSIETEAGLNPVGRWAVRDEIIQVLAKRLRAREHLRRRPETLDVPVERPVFIIGFPRTGSTMLHNLMALDPQNRVPKLWELLDPVPPESGVRGEDPRIKAARRYLRLVEYMSPLALKIHPMGAQEPDECRLLLESTFVGPQFLLYYNVPSYFDWFAGLTDDRLEVVCRELRTQIQILTQGHNAGRWVGKNPSHSAWGRGLVRAFPDACFVVLHRDPAESIPSLCSLGAAFRSILTDHVDLPALGQEALRGFVLSMDRLMEMRTAATSASFYDVHYSRLVADPIGVVRGIYAHVGMPLDHETEARMRQYLADNPQHKTGVHRYTASQFGLSRDEIHDRASRYLTWLEQQDLQLVQAGDPSSRPEAG